MPAVVLIVDDNADNILLMKRILRRSGMELEILETQSGREAVRIARENRPAIVLLDMKMPDMDGYQTTIALRSDELTRHIPVIAVTAQAMVGDKERAMQAGCNEYITKPVDPALLVSTIRKYLDEGK